MSPAKKPPTAADALIDLIISRAPALIAAGVTSLSMDGLAVMLAPPPAPAAHVDEPSAPTQHIDPMQDPATYPGGRIPGFSRPAPGGDS